MENINRKRTCRFQCLNFNKYCADLKIIDLFIEDLELGKNPELKRCMKHFVCNLIQCEKIKKLLAIPQNKHYYSIKLIKTDNGNSKKKSKSSLYFISHSNMKTCMRILEDLGYIKIFKSYFFVNPSYISESMPTCIYPTEKFIMDMSNINPDNIVIDKDKINFIELKDKITINNKKTKIFIDWDINNLSRNTKEFISARLNFLQKYNDKLASCNITCSGYSLNRCMLFSVFSRGTTHTFTKGGRFYFNSASESGLTFHNIPFKQTGYKYNDFDVYRKFIQIDGENIVELDFKALHPSMIMAKMGIQINEYPYYCLDLDKSFVKSLLLVCFNAKSKNRFKNIILQYKEKLAKKYAKIGETIPKLWIDSYNRYMSDNIKYEEELEKRFPNYFASDIGVDLQYLDSKIAQKVMKYFLSKDEICIPIHDSFIVKSKFEDELKDVMQKSYSEVMGGFTISISNADK